MVSITASSAAGLSTTTGGESVVSDLSHSTILSAVVTTYHPATMELALVRFDPDARSLYVYLQSPDKRAAKSIAAEATTVVLDLDEDGVPLGIEILLDEKQAAAFTKNRVKARP